MSKINGNLDLDTPEMKSMRAAVVEQELSARSWKAYYEKMYYSLETEKLEPLYKEYQGRLKKRLDDEKEAFEKFKVALNEEITKQNEGDTVGNLELKAVE